MPSSEGSFIGLAKQTAKGTPNSTDAEFQYLLLLRSGLGPQNVNLPLDQEVGGGAFVRNVVKVGVTSGGPIRFIPRPDSIGHFLMAFFGNVNSAVITTSAYTHTFSFGTSQFTVPYYTIRNSPGGMFGEQLQDCRLALLNFTFAARDFLRAEAAFVGGLPTDVDTAAWTPESYLDEGPQFLTVLSHIEVPDGTAWKVLSGNLSLMSNIPLDQQWIIGSYSPDDFAINSRAVQMTLRVKIADDGVLYKKMMMDPEGGTDWAADLLKEGSIDLSFISNEIAEGTTPYSLKFMANGDSGNGNVVFTVTPLDIIPGRQLVMDVTGTFLADPVADSPVSAELVSLKTTY